MTIQTETLLKQYGEHVKNIGDMKLVKMDAGVYDVFYGPEGFDSYSRFRVFRKGPTPKLIHINGLAMSEDLQKILLKEVF